MTRVAQTLLAVLLLSIGVVANAGVISPCHSPMVLTAPKIHVFILPYEGEGRLTRGGRDLATILQRHVLFAALKYRSIAVMELTGDPTECSFERTAARVNSQLKDGQAAIFLWGRLFEQGDAIHLRSIVASTVKGSVDSIDWDLDGDAGQKVRATMSSDPILFAPRKIPLQFLQTLEPARRAARRLYKEPSTSTSYFDLPDDPEARFGYEVLETRNDWMHIRLFPREAGEGWVQTHTLASGDELKGTFPELYFVDALIGYYQIRDASVRSQPASARTLEVTQRSIDRYLNESRGRAESEARATATILKGNAVLRSADKPWSLATLTTARQHYAAAHEIAPDYTAPATFYLACSSAICAREGCQEGDTLQRQFLDAVAKDPTSPELITNLATFYDVAQAGRIKVSTPPEELAQRKARTRSVEQQMK